MLTGTLFDSRHHDGRPTDRPAVPARTRLHFLWHPELGADPSCRRDGWVWADACRWVLAASCHHELQAASCKLRVAKCELQTAWNVKSDGIFESIRALLNTFVYADSYKRLYMAIDG